LAFYFHILEGSIIKAAKAFCLFNIILENTRPWRWPQKVAETCRSFTTIIL